MANPIIANNIVRVANRPETFQKMQKIGPKVCVSTASEPGFLGFEQLLQIGIHDMAGRYGGGALDMHETLNPIMMCQYTVWKDVQSHENFHYNSWPTFYELCSNCLDMVVEGPWEPVYEIVASDLSPVLGMTDVPQRIGMSMAEKTPPPKVALASKRVVALGDHGIMDGREAAFEEGAKETLQWMKKRAPGMVGWMIMKQIGVTAVGSFQLDPEGMNKQTLGANPPRYATNYGDKPPDKPFIPPEKPSQYFVHMEWESVDAAHQGIGKTMVNYDLRQIHNKGVLAHVCRGPYYRFFNPFMEEVSEWRDLLEK